MSWLELIEFKTGNKLYLRISPDTPLVVMESKEENMCYVKIDNQLVTIQGNALDTIMQVDQYLAKEDTNV